MARKNERRGGNHNLSCVPPDPHTLASIMGDVYGAVIVCEKKKGTMPL